MYQNLFKYILSVCVLLLMTDKAFGQNFPAKTYKDLDGLLSNHIYDIQLMANGEIWFGTDKGISIYDGHDWATLPDSVDFLPRYGRVMIKAVEDSGCYVVGISKDHYVLAYYDYEVWQQVPLPADFLAQDPHLDYVIDHNSLDPGIVFAYEDQIYRYIPSEGWQSFTVRDAQGPLDIRIAEMINDQLVVGTNRGLFYYDDQEREFKTIIEKVEVEKFHWDQAKERIYLMGNDWLGYFEKGKLHYFFKDRPIGLDIVNYGTSTLLVDDDVLYYAYNSTLNAYELTNHTIQKILTESFDKSYWCEDALIDHENNLWVVTARGGFKVFNRFVYNYDQKQLMENEVTAVLESSDGMIYLGSNSGFQVLEPSGKITQYYFDERFFQPRVMDIVEYKGTIYFAANSAGVVWFRNGTLNYMKIPSDRKRVVDLDLYDGKLYMANADELYILKEGSWNMIYQIESRGKVNSFIRKIFFEGPYQNLLNVNGILDYHRETLLTSDSLRGSNVYDAILFEEELYVGTKAGLGKVMAGKIELFDHYGQNETVFCMMVDSQQRFWIGTENGISNLSEHPHVRLNKQNGLAGNEINRNALRELKDGRILVGTDEGLSVLKKGFDRSNPIPKTELTGILANNEPWQKESLAHSLNNLRFQFRGISYYNENLVNYRVKLDGYEEEWQYLPLAIQRSVVYPNLNPGTYEFHVQSRVGENGEWSPEAVSDEITIKPAFYDTLLFRGSMILLTTSIIMGLIHLRNRALNNRNRKLKEKVAEKTNALNAQNLQLKEMLDDLKSTQSQLIQSEKLASMGVLTAGIAHEMNNPLNYILGGATCLQKNLEEMEALHQQILSDKKEVRNGTIKEFDFLVKESEQLLTSILNGAEKSAGIVKSLHSFSDDAKAYYSFVDLREEIDTTLTLLSNQLGLRISVIKNYADTPKIECYPARINHLLVNVLLNAFQAIPEKGTISIELKAVTSKKIQIVVSDSGEGIDLQEGVNVFEPFFSTRENHSGLGLTLVQAIVKDHHGAVSFTSQKGEGSTVTVSLPIYQTNHPELSDATEGHA